jgi:hypothetical protein
MDRMHLSSGLGHLYRCVTYQATYRFRGDIFLVRAKFRGQRNDCVDSASLSFSRGVGALSPYPHPDIIIVLFSFIIASFLRLETVEKQHR